MSDILASTVVELTKQVKALVAELRAMREEYDRATGGPLDAEVAQQDRNPHAP